MALVIGAALLVVIGVFLVLITFPMWARWAAIRQVDAGAISEAQKWLDWSAKFSSPNPKTELMRAACFRRLGQMGRWQTALESSLSMGVDPLRLEQERLLGLIRMGAQEVPEEFWKYPADVGVRPYDAIEVCVRGHLARNELRKAEQVLDFWASKTPENAHLAYLQGIYRYNQGDETKALVQFENALTRQPAHELAHTAVARLLEKQDRLTEALTAYVRFAYHCPRSDTAILGMAGVLRELGHLDEARELAERLNSTTDQLERSIEMGSNSLESGDYQEALRWFGQAPPAMAEKKWQMQKDAGIAFALLDQHTAANRLFEQANAEEDAKFLVSELLTQLAIDPDKEAAGDESQLAAAAAQAATQTNSINEERAYVAQRRNAQLSAADLYTFYCAACHGANGNGKGRAARHQFPQPRDFRTENSRLISTDNGNPSLEDLKTVIKLGMPGTSMRAFDQLAESELDLLAEEILRMRREGVRDRYVTLLAEEEEEIDEEDVREVIDLHCLPGDVIPMPAIGHSTPARIARGREVYLDTGCLPCHGDDGTGESKIALFDEQGLPSWSRDLVSDPFKGGHEPESICLRILAGMPGSPHPATKDLTDEEYVDLIHYCASLSRQPKRTLTNHERFLEATQRILPSKLQDAAATANGTADPSSSQ